MINVSCQVGQRVSGLICIMWKQKLEKRMNSTTSAKTRAAARNGQGCVAVSKDGTVVAYSGFHEYIIDISSMATNAFTKRHFWFSYFHMVEADFFSGQGVAPNHLPLNTHLWDRYSRDDCQILGIVMRNGLHELIRIIWHRTRLNITELSSIESGADPGIYFGGPNQGPQSKVKGEARIEGAKRPSIEGEARVEGAKRPRIEGEAQTEGEAREKSGGGVWGGGSVSPSPENVWKIKLETLHFCACLKQLFEMTNEMV